MIFYQKWKGRNLTKNDGEFLAKVPGNIQLDYAEYKNFGDVNYSDNYKKFLPLEDDLWEYSTKLDYVSHDGERVFFVSGGIDYIYDILLNDEKIYSYEGMFSGFEIDLTDKLRGNDTLSVVIHPHPKSKNGLAGTRDEANESCKPPVCYGWDWNPRLLTSGLWQDAFIEVRGEGYIGDVEVISTLSEELTRGKVSFTFTSKLPALCKLFDADGNQIAVTDKRAIEIEQPQLWWCNGQGKPYLYRWVIENDKEYRKGYIGFRRIRLVRNEGAGDPATFPKSRYDAPATIEINGRRIFAKGSNYVNPDIFVGTVTKDRYETQISMAKDANMNILRVWGGASVCKDTFYDLCDRYGILVWQEFMLACNNYLPTEKYMSVLEKEATAIIKRLRSHPCIALWCGGNELFNTWSGMDDQSLPLRLLNKLCYEYDRSTPFIATSPLTGMGHGGYMFYSPLQQGEVFRQFRLARNTAYSEFGVPSASSAETLRRIIPASEVFPIRKTESWIAHHGFDAWLSECWTCLDTFKKYFGDPRTLEDYCRKSAWMQCEGYKSAFEEARRQWRHCSMAINWCYNEPWVTAANNSLLEYPTKPKLAYFGVRDSLRPTLFSAKIEKFAWKAGETFEAEIWLLNDSQSEISSKTEICLKIGDSHLKLLEWSAEADVNANTQGPTVRLVLPTVDAESMTLILKNDQGFESSYTLQYNPHEAPHLAVKKSLNL